MGIENERTLFEVGGRRPRTLAISLPIAWVRYWGLHKGQTVLVISDGILVVVPPGHQNQKEIIAKVKRGLLDGF